MDFSLCGPTTTLYIGAFIIRYSHKDLLRNASSDAALADAFLNCAQEDSPHAAKPPKAGSAFVNHASSSRKEAADPVRAARGRKASKKSETAQPQAELRLETDAAKLEPASAPAEPNLSGGAVKPDTPAKVPQTPVCTQEFAQN